MRCSSCEAQLSAFVDGELGPVARARVAQHLAGCPACAAVVAELRSLDALLLTAREPELAPNFSFRVMAEVRSLPVPHAHRGRPLAVLGTYVVFAWAAIGAFLVFGGGAARGMVATLAAGFGHAAQTAAALGAATGRLFGHHTFDVTAAMGALLAVDLVAAAAFAALYALVRQRRAAPLGASKPW
ncbi:MAG: hypothetical protein NVSMB19_02570 [Vulcanimicrobiaceae bacterium]